MLFYTFNHMNEFCILRGSVVTLLRGGGQVHSHGYSSFLFWDDENNQKYVVVVVVVVVLLKMTFGIFQGKVADGELGKVTGFCCQISSLFHTPKIIKIG